jgi:hypothetical protein
MTMMSLRELSEIVTGECPLCAKKGLSR